MRREHTHRCANRVHGCQSTWTCRAEIERNYDGWPEAVCSVNPMNEHVCEDCFTSRCSECGEVLNVHQHDSDCPKATAV